MTILDYTTYDDIRAVLGVTVQALSSIFGRVIFISPF